MLEGATKMIKRLENLPSKEKLQCLGLLNLGKKMCKGGYDRDVQYYHHMEKVDREFAV